jgi:hypothetical protein
MAVTAGRILAWFRVRGGRAAKRSLDLVLELRGQFMRRVQIGACRQLHVKVDPVLATAVTAAHLVE